MQPSRLALSLAALALVPSAASAQTALGGNLSDTTTGPLLSGVVYHIASGITVSSGATLTIQPGAILKFGSGGTFTVQGTLLVNGLPGQPVILTALADDSAGGDTNGNGPSSGAPGSWTYWRFSSSASASVIENAVVRFAGAGGWNPIRLDDCAATFRECIVEDNLGAGFHLTNSLAQPTIAECTIRNNAGWAIDGARFESVRNLANNTATGNGADSVLISNPSLAVDATVHARAGIGGVLTLQATANVPPGLTLTLGRGVILKHLQAAAFEVGGTLNCQGTAGQPVVITSFADDAFGGDTNGDGPSNGSPGQWIYLRFGAASSASTLNNTILRYGGGGGWSPIRVDAASPSFVNCTVEHAAGVGAVLASPAGAPTFTGCTFRSNASWAVHAQGFESIVNLSNNTAVSNGVNGLLVTNAAPASDVVIGPQMGFGSTICLQSSVVVNAGRTLTLDAGTILKPVHAIAYEITGTLRANGTPTQPVVLTSFADDEYGGDSNSDGPSVGSAGQWSYLRFHAGSSASRLTNTLVRHGGGGGWNPIYISGGSPTLERCTIERGLNSGISLASTATQARIDDCTVRDCTGSAITGVPIEALRSITRLKASGNGANRVDVTSATLANDLYLDGNMGLNGAVVLFTQLNVPVGRKLTLGPGAIFKLAAGQTVQVLGALDVIATRERPAVFTASSDDTLGGDSDGIASTPAPGHWVYFVLDPAAAPSRIEHLLLRYGGAGGWPTLLARSPLAEYRHVRVERAGAAGIELLDAARADFFTAWSCNGTGIALAGGAFALERATAANCVTGIARSGAWNGLMGSSIAWGNSSANVSGLLPGQASYSNGVPGGANFNLNVDPHFVDALGGDLSLLASSVCVDAGDPAAPRDGDCTRADMGSQPSVSAPALYCAGKVNSFGCTPFLGFSGLPRANSAQPFTVRAFNVLNQKSGLFYYGFSGRSGAPFQGGLKCVADPVRRLPTQLSGGNSGFTDCSGVLAVDFNAVALAGFDPLLVAGATVNLQAWYRDPQVPSNTGLSNGLEFTLCN
jgi:hypothetical protein